MMKKRYKVPALAMASALLITVLFLTGCKEEEKDRTSKAYYVISEELDIKKTADKAQEILENAESRTSEDSESGASEDKKGQQ